MFEFTEFYNQKQEANKIPDFMMVNNQNKIKLVKNNIHLQFYYSSIRNNEYNMLFIVSINMPFNSQQIRASQIDMMSLKKAIFDNLDPYDQKYFILKNFSTNKAELVFNHEKWLKEAIGNEEPKKYFSLFSKQLSFKARIPQKILSNSLRGDFVAFIEKNVKEHLKAKKLEKKWLLPMFPKIVKNYVENKLFDMYDYKYDLQFNKFYITLKSVYIITLSILAYKALTIKDDEVKKAINDPKYFEISVKKNLNNYKITDKQLEDIKKGKYVVQ